MKNSKLKLIAVGSSIPFGELYFCAQPLGKKKKVSLVVVYLAYVNKEIHELKRKIAFQTLGNYFKHCHCCVTFSSHSSNVNSANIRGVD